MAFEASIDKEYVDIALHFIQSGGSQQVQLTWELVRKMLLNNKQEKGEYLVKQCIKSGTKFDPGDSSTKKIRFAGRAGGPDTAVDDKAIRLVDFIHIMLELDRSSFGDKSPSELIRERILSYCKKGKLSHADSRQLFLLFAIKRKLKLMSFMINSEDLRMEFTEENFIDVIENSAYDMGVLLQREFFLILKDRDKIAKIIALLINAFAESNGMLESKAYLLKRFVPKMSFE